MLKDFARHMNRMSAAENENSQAKRERETEAKKAQLAGNEPPRPDLTVFCGTSSAARLEDSQHSS